MKKLLILLLCWPALQLAAQKVPAWEKNFDYVDECICGLSKVGKDGKVGYVNNKGEVVIKLEYAEGLTFHDGVTAVRKETKWMYIDSNGVAITEAIYEDALPFSNGFAAVAKGGQFGFINTKGKVVIPYQFSNARSFSEGLAPAANAKGFWGYIDIVGNWMIKPQYDFTDSFENGEARVMKGDKVFWINKDNNKLHE